ncbi:MAG: aminoacyl-tRNA hydrolase [Pseudomonadota bacterium]|nr:aminoacyl-tRNA hydrolase [Pseudomonadota bacterium]
MHIQFITGLGNFSAHYEKTRHNVGFTFLDQLVVKLNLSWKKHSTACGQYCIWQHQKGRILIFKPNKLMNINGGPIAQCLQYHKIAPQHALVAYDDLSFPAGTVKLKSKGGHAGHNGVRDILNHLDDQHFYRLRFGIGRPIDKDRVSDYVLSQPSIEDSEKIQKTVAHCIENLDDVISGNYAQFQQSIASTE